ncbi:MAG: OmpH family outer membrane protein [gamma proteobacterium symbiont of Bathyaustriella thionipta]|nr:OmpH family outer membrane protein [gamma proteobacterium symbiont of Bathyaustriella thionipta]MCU7948578.1 OmpH family outer membrane protein [gamma proteobacterium symbiont of Bathyaustriella thionipta]MCU7953301.1 OmpH family outer membrane protein [gamma proteobacterium symbiont of Bathyaustriella thionipta]MCU7955084.1 OmpH family outer membrane protein [gamma proteobacterium symbiont of Bathyaustriella thionipta]MCU7967000.1 OmpH family outer membrane protein [gamma proteobacterium sy
MIAYTRLFILITLLFSVPFAYAEQKIAFVNQAKLLQKAPQAESARNKLQKEFSKRDKSLVSLQKQIIKNEEKLKKDAAILSSAELNKLKRKIILLRRDLERDKLAFKEDVSIRQNEELVKLQKSVLKSIQAIAQKEKYDLIISEGVIYASKQIDITDKILAQLKKQYSGK